MGSYKQTAHGIFPHKPAIQGKLNVKHLISIDKAREAQARAETGQSSGAADQGVWLLL